MKKKSTQNKNFVIVKGRGLACCGIRAIVGAIAMGILFSMTSTAAVRHAMPIWSMGNYDPSDKIDVTAVIGEPRLAFKGLSVSELKAKLADGYVIFGMMIGGSMGGGVRGSFVPCYNIKYYPSTGESTKIFGDFCIEDDGYAKAVCVEFSNGDDGVYVTGLQAMYNKGGRADTDFMVVDAEGKVTYKNRTDKGRTLSLSWSHGHYGVGNVQLAKFIYRDTPSLVWPGATLDEIKDYDFLGFIGGKGVSNAVE